MLAQTAALKRADAPGYGRVPWEKIYYATGNLEFWFDDFDHALQDLKKVTATSEAMKELDLNTGVLAFMRQGRFRFAETAQTRDRGISSGHQVRT